MDSPATKSVTCEECIEVLGDYLDGSMDRATHSAFEAHFSDCPPCLDFLHTYKATILVSQRALIDTPIPAEVQSRLRSFLRERCQGKKPGSAS